MASQQQIINGAIRAERQRANREAQIARQKAHAQLVATRQAANKQITEARQAAAYAVANAGIAPTPSPSPSNPAPIIDPRDYRGPDFIEDFTVYEIDFANLTAGSTQNGNFLIQADSAFKWTKATYFAAAQPVVAFNDSTRPIPAVTVSILDNGSSRQLFSNPVPIPNLFGTGQLPFILPVERVFEARSSVSVTVQNFDSATAYNIRLSFVGAKIFNYKQK